MTVIYLLIPISIVYLFADFWVKKAGKAEDSVFIKRLTGGKYD